MANPTVLTRPKNIGFSLASGFGEKVHFQVWNVNTDEIIRTNNANQDLRVGSTKNGTFNTSWFSGAVSINDKLIISVSGAAYGSKSIIITAGSGSQKVTGTITAVTTDLPAVNMWEYVR